MSRKLIVLLGSLVVVFVIFIIFGIVFASGYNNLVDKDVTVDSAYSQVENRLLQRHDEITQLVQVVEGLTAEEQAIFDAITEVRESYSGNAPIQDDAAETAAFNSLLAIIEDNIEIVSDAAYLNLMETVVQMEAALSQARKDYNDVVAEYNSAVRRFPNIIFANMFGFSSEYSYWSVDGSVTSVPSITFNN